MKTLSKRASVLFFITLLVLLTGSTTNGKTLTLCDSSTVETKGQEWNDKKDTIFVQTDSTQVTVIPDSIIALQKPNVQVQYYARYYAAMYNIPEKYMFRVPKKETGYDPNDSTYNPYKRELVSKCGARGPYQILPKTGKAIWKDSLSLSTKEMAHKLQYDIKFNVHTAAKLISELYDMYGNWKVVFSVYNQGTIGARRINRYAKFIVAD